MFTNIYGHNRITSYLEGLIESEDLPSCMLFHGPEGVGKRTTAIELAKRLNCTGTRKAGCSCSSCTKIQAGNHLDVLWYEPDGNTFKIDQVREIIGESNRSRMEGDWRIFVLEDAHKLGVKAADALLKTLEDGRDNSLFVLLSTSKAALVPTLVSRALDFYFGALAEEDVEKVLESLGYESTANRTAIRLGGGRISRTLYFMTDEGRALRDEVLGLLGEYPRVKDFRLIKEVDKRSEDIGDFLETLYVLLSDACLLNRSMGAYIQNYDVRDRISLISDRFREKCFDAFSRVRGVRHKKNDPIAVDHHVKSLLLDLKDVLR